MDLGSPVLQWLNAHPEFSGLATFVISAAESVAIIGTIIPGSLTMIAIGTLAGSGVIPLWPTIFWAILGAIVGDGISYWIGHYFKARLPRIWPFRNYPGFLANGEKFVLKYGAMSVFIGRFVGPVRALVPLVAGMLGMKPLQFTIANVLSAILWAPAYMMPGILVGVLSLELPPDIAVHVILVLFLFSLFIMLCLWFIYKLLQLINNQTNQLQNFIWRKIKYSAHFSSFSKMLQYHNSQQPPGQLKTAFYFIITSSLFIFFAAYIAYYGPGNILVNDIVYHFFRGIRTPSLDVVMLKITFLGQKQVLIPVFLTLVLGLIYFKRYRAATHAMALCILATISTFVIKNILQIPRPWGVYNPIETFSMPSGHTVLSTTLFFGVIFLISTSYSFKTRRFLYICATLIVLIIGISRLYLGAHWFTDVIQGWLLSASVLFLMIISYQRLLEKPIHPAGILLFTLPTLILAYSFFYQQKFIEYQINYAQIFPPPVELSADKWWEKNPLLAVRTSLFGFPSQEINIVWWGSLEEIRQTLMQNGWATPPQRNWISTLHRIADVKSTQYLPLVSPQYLDKKPELILARSINNKSLLVLRLWDSNLQIRNTDKKHIWVGMIGLAPRSYSWIYRSRASASIVNIEPQLVFSSNHLAKNWDWKFMHIQGKTPAKKQTILMLRKSLK